MGNVLRRYFAADLPRQPDDRFLVGADAPFDFMRVDPVWLAGGDSARASISRAEASR
jgi:hypothetical protein